MQEAAMDNTAMDIDEPSAVNTTEIEFGVVWTPIEQYLTEFLINPASSISVASYMESYSSVYNFCTKNAPLHNRLEGNEVIFGRLEQPVIRGGLVYNNLRRTVTRFCAETAETSAGLESSGLIHFYHVKWKRYLKLSKIADHLMAYLNRVWVPQSAVTRGPVCRVFEMVLKVWRDLVFNDLSERLTSALISEINDERSGGLANNLMLKDILLSFLELDFTPEIENTNSVTSKEFSDRTHIYRKRFEDAFLTATSTFYASESVRLLSEASVSDYVRIANKRLKEESDRVDRYLVASTKKPLIALCQSRLIKDHNVHFLEELRLLLRADRFQEIKELYLLVSNIPGLLDPLRQGFESHVRQYGLEAIEKIASGGSADGSNTDFARGDEMDVSGDQGGNQAVPMDTSAAASSSSTAATQVGSCAGEDTTIDARIYVDAILVVRDKYVKVVMESFAGDQGFMAAMDKACREFVNSNAVCRTSTRSPELIARYTDVLLRRTARNLEDEELEKALSNVLIAFKYIEDKDVFQKFYSKLLCKRLINQQSVSDEMERWMISHLKDACGYEYISKLQRMFTDIDLSRDLNASFAEHLRSGSNPVGDFQVMVLSSASWPLGPSTEDIVLPPELMQAQTQFTEFYNGKFNGRRLNWVYGQSRCELKAQFEPSRPSYVLHVNMYQLKILLMFNNGDSFTMNEIAAATKLENPIIEGNMLLLVKSRILNATPGPPAAYSINTGYRNKKMRINLNVPIRSEARADREDTQKTIEDDRRFLIQAAIVRIMKTKRTLKHAQLVQEVLEQLNVRFRPSAQDIKKTVAELMEKEYIERVEGEKDTYAYIA